MARLPALVDALAAADGRPRGAIDHVARAVREAGFIQTTKRGRGAAEMTAEDAAALLIALYGARDPASAAEAVQAFAALPRVRPTDRVWKDLPDWLASLQRARTCLQALSAVIEATPRFKPLDGQLTDGVRFHVYIYRPRLGLQVELVNPARPRPDWVHLVAFGDKRQEFGDAYDNVTRLKLPLFSAIHRALHPEALGV